MAPASSLGVWLGDTRIAEEEGQGTSDSCVWN
jgi:hypothetical protein